MKRFFAIIATIVLLAAYQDEKNVIYVSTKGNDNNSGTRSAPIASLEKAKLLILQKVGQGIPEITVKLEAGTYFLENTITFTAQELQQSRVRWVGDSQAETIISGGIKIENWQQEPNGWWSAPIGDAYFEQLYVNGKRATRARTPNADAEIPQWFLKKTQYVGLSLEKEPDSLSIYFPDSVSLKQIKSTENAEIVVLKDWATFRKQILSIDTMQNVVVAKPPFMIPKIDKDGHEHNALNNQNRVPGFSAYFTGNISMIDQAGEWAISQQRVYYKPHAEEKIENTTFFAPQHTVLLSLEGTAEKPIQHVTFEHIHFAHAAYHLPEKGHDGAQAAMFYHQERLAENLEAGVLPAAVLLQYAQHCAFKHCRFTQLGGNGILIGEGCKNDTLSYCHVADVGANGVMLGTKKNPKEDTLALVQRHLITHCTITKTGQHYPSGVGIWLGFTAYVEVSNNKVYDLPYTGISAGWIWNPTETPACCNKINYNEVHDVMKILGDGGGIYVLGNQPHSEIIGNTVYNVWRSEFNKASPNNGLYFDEGSRNFYAARNKIYNISHAPIRGHRTAGVVVENNHLIYQDSLSPVYLTPPYDKPIYVKENQKVFWIKPKWMTNQPWYPDTVHAFNLINNKFEVSAWSN